MKRHLCIAGEPIDERSLMSRRPFSPGTGAVVYFAGVVRDTEAGRTIRALEYEVFPAMAEHQFAMIFEEIEHRWPIESIRLIHRVGVVPVNEPSLWVEVAAPHREEAFAACQFLIDAMKRQVPIWKKPLT